MDFIFADDARQLRPSRPGMGQLIAIGGIHVPSESVGHLERAIEGLCGEFGVPSDEQFKWSPGKKEPFMKTQLVSDDRLAFFDKLLSLALRHQAQATVVIEDTSRRPARPHATSHEHDITSLFLERADWSLRAAGREGVVIIAAPSGGAKDEEHFLAECVEIIDSGTEYSQLPNIGLRVLLAKSRLIRSLQLADVVVSCTVARVSGEDRFSPAVFEMLKPLFRHDGSRIGGVGLKLHPDFCFANLYHWLLGDTDWWKGNSGCPLPVRGFPYFNSEADLASRAASST